MLSKLLRNGSVAASGNPTTAILSALLHPGVDLDFNLVCFNADDRIRKTLEGISERYHVLLPTFCKNCFYLAKRMGWRNDPGT